MNTEKGVHDVYPYSLQLSGEEKHEIIKPFYSLPGKGAINVGHEYVVTEENELFKFSDIEDQP